MQQYANERGLSCEERFLVSSRKTKDGKFGGQVARTGDFSDLARLIRYPASGGRHHFFCSGTQRLGGGSTLI